MPDFVSMGKSAPDRTEHDEDQQQCYQQPSLPKQPDDEREKEIKHFFYRKRPKDVPVARQVRAPGFENIDMKGKCGEQGAPESPRMFRNDKMRNTRKVKDAQHGQQCQEKRRNTSESHPIKSQHVHR